MNNFTLRFAHLRDKTPYPLGYKFRQGDAFSIMGNTGQSTGDHVHMDCVEGFVKRCYRLWEMGPGCNLIPRPDQLLYTLEDDNLFHATPIITTPYCELAYWLKYAKRHYGYDMIPKGYDSETVYPLYWPRSWEGHIVGAGHDPGYGNYINIGFTT